MDPWLESLWPALRSHFPLPPGTDEPAPGDTATQLVCKYRVTWLSAEEAAAAAAASSSGSNGGSNGGSPSWSAHQEAMAAAALFDAVEAAASGLLPAAQQGMQQPASRAPGGPASTTGRDGGGGYGPRRPAWCRLAANRRITAPTHFQDVRQLDIDLAGSGLTYQPGDVLAVAPQQPAAAVDALLRRCGWDSDAWVRVEPAAGAGAAEEATAAAPGGSGGSPSATVRLGALVAGALDINGASPRRFFFQVCAGLSWA